MPELETVEELEASIAESQKKLADIRKNEAKVEEEQNLIDMPVADVRLRISKFQEVEKKGVTPAELAILVRFHHAKAGGNPVLSCKPTGVIKRDPRAERYRLISLYSKKEIIQEMFPGMEPSLPSSFRRAMEIGITLPGSDDKYMFKMSLTEASA